ncbi:ATPase, partial [Diplocarpon rosae]
MASSSGSLPDLTQATISASGPSIYEMIRRFQPTNIAFLKAFFSTWLKLDLTTLAAALTIFSTISSVARVVQGLALKLYWYFTKFFTASISVAPSDKLNKEILNWIGAQVLTRQGTRILTARTESVPSPYYWMENKKTERNDLLLDKRVPIQYLPTFGTTWFIFERNVFMVKRISPRIHELIPDEYASAPDGKEPLVVMVLGRSVAPLKRFLEMTREFADKQREAFITVHAARSDSYSSKPWDTTILRPHRPLDTVHFDETIKAELVADITNYLNPVTRRFYTARGIPYRRGYLLHGTPGTGKTSLSLALSGTFGLDLYLVHIPSVRRDTELEKLFTDLPPRCIVLLEDIDAVGLKRRPAMGDSEEEEKGDNSDDSEEEEDDSDDRNPGRDSSRCTLSGLLNVLDGVTSQEGRIVLMTTNHVKKLDKALVRPGRIDRTILLGNISPRSAELMFLRMYNPGEMAPETSLFLKDGDLEKLALQFSSQIPDNVLTPAQLQGYLLNHRSSARMAVDEIQEWVVEEKRKKEVEKQRNKQVAEWKKKKKRQNALAVLAKTMGTEGTSAEAEGSKKGSGKGSATENIDVASKESTKTAAGEDAGEVPEKVEAEQQVAAGANEQKLAVEQTKPPTTGNDTTVDGSASPLQAGPKDETS